MAIKSQTLDTQPWYRERWPWILFGLPGIVVVASVVTLFFALYWNRDGVVPDDIDKEGKAIVKNTVRQQHARELGLSAHMKLGDGTVTVILSAAQEQDLPAALQLTIVHPTIDRLDQRVRLQKGADAAYSGVIAPLIPLRAGHHWQFQVEDESRSWRMDGIGNIPTETEISIRPFDS